MYWKGLLSKGKNYVCEENIDFNLRNEVRMENLPQFYIIVACDRVDLQRKRSTGVDGFVGETCKEEIRLITRGMG